MTAGKFLLCCLFAGTLLACEISIRPCGARNASRNTPKLEEGSLFANNANSP